MTRHAQVLRLLAAVDDVLTRWHAYKADQARPPDARLGVRPPPVALGSCRRLQERLLAELARIEAGAPYPN